MLPARPSVRSMSDPTLSSTLKLPRPLQIVEFDHRPKSLIDKHEQDRLGASDGTSSPIKIVSWNLERGYRLEEIIAELKEIDADVLCLQELDIACMRSGTLDTVQALSKALGYTGVFVAEFEELYDNIRSIRDQGGGVHGNAIMSKYPLKEAHVIDHKYQPVDWDREGHELREPRRGRRCSIAAVIETPLNEPLLCYSVHLEVFTGILGRLAQFSEILEFAQERLEEYPYQVIAGDLNTNAHGLARISPYFCCDKLRFFSFGRSEAEWWTDNLLSTPYPPHIPNQLLQPYFRMMAPSFIPESHVTTILKNLRNPGFYDPWRPTDVTLRSYGGWYSAKLDWLLCRGVEVVTWRRGNKELNASDHMWLAATIAVPTTGPHLTLMSNKRPRTPSIKEETVPSKQKYGIIGKEAWVARDRPQRYKKETRLFGISVQSCLTMLALSSALGATYYQYTRGKQ